MEPSVMLMCIQLRQGRRGAGMHGVGLDRKAVELESFHRLGWVRLQ
jgi:hypothetical protein